MVTRLCDVQTPCLVLDREKLKNNLGRMAQYTANRNVASRPHLKTAKSIDVARMAADIYGGTATVSTLKEAEVFGPAGFPDILYAVAITPQKLDRVAALKKQGIDIKVVIDSVEMARHLTDYSRKNGIVIPTLIELDLDGHRSGVRADDTEKLIAIGSELSNCGQLSGIMAHAGSSYSLSDPGSLLEAARGEQAAACKAADTLRNAGLSCDIVSVGSTPTALSGQNADGITEIRAGVYMFFDLVQSNIGVCTQEDIAISVLTTVISVQPEANRLVTDAGWMALSSDRGTAKQKTDYGFGQVCTVDGTPLPDVLVLNAQQEHGIIGVRSGSTRKVPEMKIGDQLRILPNHACATAAQYDSYHVIDGGDVIQAVWPRFSGW